MREIIAILALQDAQSAIKMDALLAKLATILVVINA